MTVTQHTIDLGPYALQARWLKQDPKPGAPVLIFLHDSLGCIALWRGFPEQMAAGCGLNALVYERRGYGHSDPMPGPQRGTNYLHDEADILLSVMDREGISEAILWGFSDGGSIALIAAARFPERINACIVQGAHVLVEEKTLQGVQDAVTAYRETQLRERLRKYHGDHTDCLFAAWTDTWLSPAFRDWQLLDLLPDIHCPVLVLQGADDAFGTADQVTAIANGVSGYREIHLLAGAGHTAHRDQPAQVTALSLAFIRKLTTG